MRNLCHEDEDKVNFNICIRVSFSRESTSPLQMYLKEIGSHTLPRSPERS